MSKTIEELEDDAWDDAAGRATPHVAALLRFFHCPDGGDGDEASAAAQALADLFSVPPPTREGADRPERPLERPRAPTGGDDFDEWFEKRQQVRGKDGLPWPSDCAIKWCRAAWEARGAEVVDLQRMLEHERESARATEDSDDERYRVLEARLAEVEEALARELKGAEADEKAVRRFGDALARESLGHLKLGVPLCLYLGYPALPRVEALCERKRAEARAEQAERDRESIRLAWEGAIAERDRVTAVARALASDNYWAWMDDDDDDLPTLVDGIQVRITAGCLRGLIAKGRAEATEAAARTGEAQILRLEEMRKNAPSNIKEMLTVARNAVVEVVNELRASTHRKADAGPADPGDDPARRRRGHLLSVLRTRRGEHRAMNQELTEPQRKLLDEIRRARGGVKRIPNGRTWRDYVAEGLVELGLITCRIAGGKRHLRLVTEHTGEP